MEANISKEFTLNEPIEKVWAGISDPLRISGCVPGASITEKLDETHYKGEVMLKLGPVKAKFDGQITIEEMDHDRHYLVLKGKGSDAKGKGSAEMSMSGTLTTSGDNTTVDFNMSVAIQGKLAQFGSRLINEVSDQLMDQFIENFKSMLGGEEFNNELKAGKMMGSIIKDKVIGVFRKKDSDQEEEGKD